MTRTGSPLFVFQWDEHEGRVSPPLTERGGSSCGISPSDTERFDGNLAFYKYQTARPIYTSAASVKAKFDFHQVDDCAKAVQGIFSAIETHLPVSASCGTASFMTLALGSILRDVCGWHVCLASTTHHNVLASPEWFEGVLTAGPCGRSVCIVDFDFRSKFTIAKPSSQFESFLDTVPKVFIGSMEDLKFEVHRASMALQHTLAERGIPAAPWRKPQPLMAMYSACLHAEVLETNEVLDAVTKRVQHQRVLSPFLPHSMSLSVLSEGSTEKEGHTEAIAIAASLRESLELHHPRMCEQMKKAEPNEEEEDCFEKIVYSSSEETCSGLSCQLDAASRMCPQITRNVSQQSQLDLSSLFSHNVEP